MGWSKTTLVGLTVLELIPLTDLNGSTLWVESTQVAVIRGKTDSCKSNVGATIRVGGVAFCIRETPEEVRDRVRSVNGKR